MRKQRVILLTILVPFICSISIAPVIAAVPQVINYQGRLTDSAGYPVDTTVQMSFTIFDDGGASMWTEIHSSVVVSNGLFNILLGNTSPIPDSVFDHPDTYLGMKVGANPEATPRTRLVSVPYAMRSSQSDTAEVLIPVIIETKTTSFTTGAVGPDAGGFAVLFDSTFTRPPVVYAVTNLRSDGGGYPRGSSLVAEFTVTLEGFSGVIYTVQGGFAMSGASIDMIYIALQIGS